MANLKAVPGRARMVLGYWERVLILILIFTLPVRGIAGAALCSQYGYSYLVLPVVKPGILLPLAWHSDGSPRSLAAADNGLLRRR